VDRHVVGYVEETVEILAHLDLAAVDAVVAELASVRSRGGRVFFIGSGGGAAHASHAAADFRKLGEFEAYTPTDNVSELTARVNDDGWETSYVNWLKGSRLGAKDMVFVFSVGGGDRGRGVSANLVACLDYAQEVGASVCGIVGRDGGHALRMADACIVVPTVNPGAVTPHTEGMQAVLWHLLVTHPLLQRGSMKWESEES
jgi:D-sedoheptulose 7-phosphate isomerase